MVSEYPGSCHCGEIRFTVSAAPTERTTCDCSLCVKRNAVMVKIPDHALRIDRGADRLATYRWNSGVAVHHFCPTCGIYVFHRKRAAPDHYGVNVFCLDGFDPASLPLRATEGASMTIVCAAPRPEWPGPRTASAATD